MSSEVVSKIEETWSNRERLYCLPVSVNHEVGELPVNTGVKSAQRKTVPVYTMCEGLRSNKNCLSRIIPVTFTKQKCQELISWYTKTHEYPEVSLVVIPHYFGCINLDSEWVYLCTCVLVLFLLCLIILTCLLYCSSILVNLVISTGELLILNILTFLWSSVICSGTRIKITHGVNYPP